MQMHTPAKAPLLSIAEAAELLSISRATVYRLIGAGELPALRVGHSLRIDRDEMDAWLYGANREHPNHVARTGCVRAV